MPRHPEDPGLDYLYGDPVTDREFDVRRLDAAIDRRELFKDELPPDVMDEFDVGSGE